MIHKRIKDPKWNLLTRFQLAWEVDQWQWEIGEYTYGKPLVLEPEMAMLKIGNYCSIAPDVTIALGNHRTDLVTTYPFNVLKEYWGNFPEHYEDHDTKGDVIIHDDVWIGKNSIILSGVEIGTGAVIGAHSVVSKSVAPYTIVAGNPARPIKKRFSEEICNRLLKISWWKWEKEKVEKFLPLLLSNDIEKFLTEAEKS
ncbi:CatB-related O-acetyltransferase [Entomobacter blattae]|uniref:2,3,4,5-tetrahydropyridine-2,6-dicarboxylate N-acetyltransferase n=1 Tax=Entomobacter blattae TaxID=2762277 RepID=A0A7H1NSZ2_9PROT|nr:CatB-related O-acetyltransferase [Entomobacter blattae]QNT78902.1 2,3,4,5-tetrahydropyridine-2,6-dicarboxylate N-acetyltransferase [Entomobacter blattae]